MRTILLVLLGMLVLSSPAGAVEKKKKPRKSATALDSTIRWMTINEAEEAMKKQPKMVFIDVYTGWCGWCKVMDRKTFSNKDLARYMNEHFYAVKLDAEQKDTIRFMGKNFGFVPAQRSNQLAAELLQGRMSYPTTVILDDKFQLVTPIPGYQNVLTMEKILKYIATETYKTIQFPEYEKTFVGAWKEEDNAGTAATGGH